MVIDEYSSNTFWSELIDLYQAKNPTAMITPTKRIDYSQYAAIYRAILESRGTSDGDWWRDVFRGYRPQPLFQDAIGNHSERLSGYDVAADIYWKTLPQKEATRLTARRGNAANTFGAWLSLAQLFLSRVTGKTEYLLGVPTSTRSVDPRFVSVMGYCMTLAVLPVSLDLDQDSLLFEADTLEKYRQCVAHDQRVEDILSWLAEENQTENTANVDALFVYHDPLDSSLDLGNSGLHYKKLADATGGSHYHLILHLDNSGPSIRLVVELSCSDEQRSVGEIVSTAPSQALQFAVEASTRQAGPVLQELRRRGENLNILDHIYMTTSVNQSAIAIATAERNVTYRQLLEWVSGVASKLRREGVKTGDIVVLFMDKSVEYLVSVLALIRVGACFVPLDITNTLAVNNSKLAVLAPTLILTRRHVNGAVYEDENYYRKLDASSIRRIAISTPPQVDQPHHSVHEAKTSTTELSADAYIAFTSGSTAEPKCFRISHRALVSSICSQVEALNISTGHRVAMLTSLAFDVSLMEIFCTFVAGSTLVVAPHDQFITSLADTLRNMAVTHAIATPTMLAAIDSPSEVPSLESIILGGEPIPSALYERWWGTVDIRISYGPAETTIATHDFIVTTKPTTNSCNIGRPSPSVRAFVLDAQHNPVLPGIPGCLFIGAAEDGKYDQLTSGYISPLSANKRLVDHPKLGRLYDTGDIVRYDLQGTFTLIGRTDDQVKISGVRFNIGDVEKTIDVFVGARRRCAVVISETQPGNKALTCFIEFSDTNNSIAIPSERHAAIASIILLLNNTRCEELAALRDRVSEALPAAMIPKYWIPVKELPVSRTGKIDRRRLNEELASAHRHGTNIEAYSSLVAQISHLHEARDDEEVIKSSQSLQYPASGSVPSYRERLNDELMQSLVIAWTEILPIDETQVDIHRSFFKTGGDSVSAIRFCARARKLGIRGCTVAKMRSNPSLSQLHDVLAYDNSSLLSNMPSSDDEPTDEASGLTPPSSMPSTPSSSGSSFVKLPGAIDFTALSISGHSVSTTDVDDEEFTGIFRHVESFMNTSELSQEIAAAGINESEVDVVYPPTAMQSSMVQQSLLDSNSGVYHSQLILHLEGPVQEMKLRKAWSAVCNANPSLRTIFVPLERGHVPGREHVMERPSHKRIEAALQTAILSSEFQARAEAFGVTPFTIVQLAFALALEGSWIDHRPSTRVGFWTVTSGRSQMVDDINAIGNFLNTIPCVVALSSTTSVHKSLQATYRMFTKMSEHDCVSTTDILRCFEKPECDIDALLVFENHPDASEPQLHFGNNIRLNSVDGREVSSLPFVVVVEPGQTEVKIIAKFDEARHHSGSLDDLTDRLAIYLSRQDNSNSKIVPIVLEKSPWMVIAMLAVLKSGRAYCPLEFDAPSHRISFAIKRLGAGLIITNENGFPKLASLSAWGHPQILVIDNIQTLLANTETRTSRDAVSLLPTLHPDMACYVMFTSGSTSSPKACTLTHDAVASAVQAVQPLYNFEPSSRILLFANYVFDASAIDIWGSLSSGSCLFLLHDDELKSDLIGHIDRLRINWIHLTPTVLRTISPDQVPSLKTIILGGEMMVPDLLNIWAKQVEIVAAYGPTEAAIQVLTFRPSRYPIDEITYTSLPGNLVVVVNERREICHINEPGEIVIAGKQLFVGYEGNSLATQAALTTIHGFGDFKFYKTGDRAYYSHIGEDGKPHIRILGRVDHQMKVSGMRIAPEEIEEVLNADPDVVCSAVVASYGRSIDALVVGRDNNINVDRLMTLCRERLPERLRPVIHQVKEIPLLASRKVDRKRLSTLLDNVIASKPGGRSSSLVSQHDSAKISAVTAIIENVLGTKVLDVNAPLASLGLDSLGFMRLKHSLCTKFHLPDLTYRQLRNIATAAGIADLVDMASPLAVSSDHDANWQIFGPSESIGHVGSSGTLTRYDVQCSADVVHRLEMFRTTFEFDLSAGKLYQVVHNETLVAVQISQISHIDIDDLRARFIPHNCATIDLRNGPLAIFHLIADGRTVVLHSTIHHIIVDEFTSIQLFNLIRCASKGSSDPCAFEGTSSIALHAAQTADRHDENGLNEWKQRMSGAIGIDTESHYEGSYDQLSRLGVDFALESDMAINKVASACGLDTANFMIQFIMHDAQSYDDMSSDMTDMTLDLITSEKPMFDLMWHVFAHKNCLDVLVEFNEQKYAKDHIKILVQAWEKVIDKSNCQGGQSISSILSTIIPEDSLLKKTDSNTKLTKQACELQVPPPSDLTSSHEHRATSTPIDISGGLNQRAIELQSLVTDSLCRALGVTVVDLDQNLREIGLDSFAAMSFIASILRVEPELEISLRDITACPSVRLLVDTLVQKDGPQSKYDEARVRFESLIRESLCKSLGIASIDRQSSLRELGLDSFSYISVSMRDVMSCPTMESLVENFADRALSETCDNKSDDGSYVALGKDMLQRPQHGLASSMQKRFYLLQEQLGDSTYSLPSAYRVHDIVTEHDIFRTHFDFTDEKRLDDVIAAEEFDLAEGHLYIIINFHHCVADERTITGVWEELCSAVTDKSCSKETANVDTGSYIDFSTRHHEMLKSNKLAEAKTFFCNLLVGPETESYPDAITINRGTIFDYDPVQWAYKSGSTPFAAYLFTFQLLLSFKSGTEGSSNLFTKLAGTCSMTETLRDFQDCLAKILEYSDIPFERLLESIGWGANDFDTIFTYHNVPAGAREKARTIEPCKGILPEVLPGISAKFPLAFTITREMTKDGKSKLDMSVEFNPDRISEAEVLEICKEYECLLRHIQKLGPYASLNDIEVATNGTTGESQSHKDTSVTQRDSRSELQPVSKVPSWFHGMPNPIVETTPFADVQILDQAKARPSATAMIFENEISITYKEMVDMISGLASYLSTRIGPQNMLNQAICIVGDASIERIITILAIMTAGGAYVPIELNNPIDWNLTIIADCEPAAVVFIPEKEPLRVEQASQLRAQLKAKGILCVDINTPLPMASEPFKLTTKRLPEHLAYVLYTSGSTGKPKGVAIQNHALRNATVSLRPLYRLAPNKRLLQLAPWTFDVSVIDIFGTLTVGATLCIGRKSWMLDDLQDTMAMLRITHIATTPTIAGALDANALPDVECLDIGGEPMTELCRDVWASKATLFNIYGPTEATVDVLGRQCFPDTDISNIGRPLENVFVYVLDDKLMQVGIGEVGQLAIGGHQLARGYLKPPPGAAAFVDTKDYGRIYLTGDCARFEPDGSIVCLGRMDTMVNLRGLRVELGAIESAVNNVLDQGKSVVIMIKRPSGDCLVAIFTDASLQTKDSLKPLSLAGLRPLIQKLQASVKDKLPAYFMPSLWVPVNDIPMNNNGKLDRKMIKSLIGELSEEALDGYLPQSATDEKLDNIDDLSRELPSSLPFQQSRASESGLLQDNTIGVHTQDIVMQAPGKSEQDTCDQIGMAVRAAFRTVLGTKSLENNSNFFSMGGDSISVIKLRSAFTKAGLKCKVKDIYQNPTIGALTLFFGGTISQESPNGIDATGTSTSSSAVAQVQVPTERPLITTPAPTTESRIQSAFKEILGDRQFPMDASFFSMGGDSISVIRLRSVLTKAAFTLKVKDIYQNPTITALADFLDPGRSTRNSTDNGKSQMVSNLRANENWFNQGHIIKLNKKHTYEDFQRAWSNIVEAHPMLRLVVSKSATHEHGKFIGIPNESTNHTYFLGKRLSSMEELPEELSKLQSCLNLSSGRICAVGGFHIGDELYCAIFAHHLAVDVVSWQVIWSDLEDLLQGDSIEPEFSSFPEWAEYLLKKRQIAEQMPARIHAREYSSFLTTKQMKRLPENTEASGNFMSVKVDVSTLDLRREDTEPVDMMLASLVLALSTWQRRRPPMNQVELHFESHGRDLELEELDLTRTVGWFTRIIPIAFNVPLQGSVKDFTTMVQQTRKHAMSSVNLASAIETAPVDGMVTFNYLGQRARTSSYTSFENVEMDLGMYQSPTNQRFSILDIECSLTHEGQLDIGVFYSTAIHTANEIRQLLDSWSYCIRSVAGESQVDIAGMHRIAVGRGTSGPPTENLGTPIDHSTYSIPECMEDQKDAIEESIAAWKLNTQDIEKMAPATDGQAAMLLASLGSRSYMHSYNYEASDTNTDIQRLQHAWDVVLGRHSIFRTIFMPLSPQATYSEKSHHSDIQLVQVILKATALPNPLVQTGKRLKPMQPGFAKQLCRLHIHKSSTTQKVICTWTCHHALIDGFSMRLVLDEVRSVYNGRALAPQITQFSDIVVSRYEKGRQDPRSNDFWQSQMRDIEPSILVNPLRADQVQTEMQRAIHETPIDRHQQFCFPVNPKHFKDAAHYNHTTIPILFHAAWALTLSTYLSARDVVLGSVVSGRRGEDIERIQNVVGPCLNTVPLRVCVDWNQNMCQFIEHVTDIFLDMAEHEDLLSLKQIQGLSGKKTLFNSTLITNTPLKSENIVQSGFHLTLKDMDEVTDVPVLLNMSCEDSTIHVADARRDTTRPLQSMDLLETNHHRVIDDLVSGPRFPIEYDGLTCSQLLQSRVSRSPDQSAVELYRKKGQKPVVMTYKAMSTIVELGAKRLRAGANLEPKSRVAIFLDKSTELICAIHAIHRADCAYVALDIDNPQARTKLLLEQINPSAIICSKGTLKLLPQTFLGNDKCPFIVAEQLFSPATQSSNDSYYLPPSTATSDDVAAILFTSGTTGTPKAVIMPHRQVVGYGIMMAEAIGYSSDDRVFNFARLVFDVSQSDIFGAIYSGATLVLAPQTETVSRLPALLRESGTTSLNTTPSIASLLYPDSLPHIRSLCLAGDLGAYDSNGEIVVVVLLLDSNLVAFCCKLESSNDGLNDSMAQTLASMETQAHQMLPSFMIPKCFVPVSAIPLTGNSKVDQLKLHEIYKQWKAQRGIPVHDATALTLRPTVEAPEKSTYEQQVPPQHNGRPQDIDWSLREDDWSDYLLPYFNPKAPLGSQPRGQIFAFFAITGTSKQHSILAPYLPSFNLIGVENIFFHQPDYYNSLQAMAVEHSALIRRQQPTGPYLLAGFSFAGQLAYEVANELRHLGEDDVRVVLIDSAARERAPTRPGGVTDAECEKFFKVPTTLEATAAGPEVVEYRQGLLNQIRHNITLHNEYVPRPFDGNALIIPRLPNQGESWDGDETNGYAEFVPQARLQVRTVTAADHFAVMEEEQSLRKVGQFIEEFMAGF
ncbi:hypothetical protein HDV62DRAFT_398717 [Trichoderma sp. SZMC 28011]